MAIGHSMWAAHFLLPFFVLGVLELLEGGERHTRALLALTLFAMLLRGGFHLFAWCVLFLLLLAACNPRRAPEVGRVLAWAAALGAVRLAPAAFLARHREQPFLSGFASAGDLWHALASVRDAAEPLRGGFFGLLGWWEYDTYVGLAGLVWLAVFGVVLARRQPALPGRAERGLYGPACALAALSLGDSYLILNLSPLPVLNAERVSARLLVLPLVFLATLAALRMQRVAESWPRSGPRARAWSVATAGVGLALSGALLAHGALWRVAHLQQLLPARRGLMNVELAAPPPLVGSELAYVVVLAASAVVSVIALALVLRELRRAYGPISPT